MTERAPPSRTLQGRVAMWLWPCALRALKRDARTPHARRAVPRLAGAAGTCCLHRNLCRGLAPVLAADACRWQITQVVCDSMTIVRARSIPPPSSSPSCSELLPLSSFRHLWTAATNGVRQFTTRWQLSALQADVVHACGITPPLSCHDLPPLGCSRRLPEPLGCSRPRWSRPHTQHGPRLNPEP